MPSFVLIFKADGTTPVTANTLLTLAELQELTFKTKPNLKGTGNLVWKVGDNGGIANLGVDILTETLKITVQ